MPQKALIVGGGIAGMSAAIALKRIGLSVDVVERNAANSVLGVGIYLPSPALRSLYLLDLLPAVQEAGTPLDGLIFHDADGSNPHFVPPLDCLGDGFPKLMAIPRPAYSGILTEGAKRAGADIRYHIAPTALHDHPSHVEVELSDGTKTSYDFVVGADGIRSATRTMIWGELGRAVFSGQVAWRYNLPRMPNITATLLFNGPQRTAGLIPLNNDLMYMLLTDPSGEMRPPDGPLDVVFRDKLAPFGGLIGHLRDTCIDDPAKVVWKAFETVDLPSPWYRGRTIIIGDAAHATTAHLGMGGAMAMEDGYVLGDEFAKTDNVADAFSAFMRRRFDRVRLVSDTSSRISRAELEGRPQEADHGALIAEVFERMQAAP